MSVPQDTVSFNESSTSIPQLSVSMTETTQLEQILIENQVLKQELEEAKIAAANTKQRGNARFEELQQKTDFFTAQMMGREETLNEESASAAQQIRTLKLVNHSQDARVHELTQMYEGRLEHALRRLVEEQSDNHNLRQQTRMYESQLDDIRTMLRTTLANETTLKGLIQETIACAMQLNQLSMDLRASNAEWQNACISENRAHANTQAHLQAADNDYFQLHQEFDKLQLALKLQDIDFFSLLDERDDLQTRIKKVEYVSNLALDEHSRDRPLLYQKQIELAKTKARLEAKDRDYAELLRNFNLIQRTAMEQDEQIAELMNDNENVYDRLDASEDAFAHLMQERDRERPLLQQSRDELAKAHAKIEEQTIKIANYKQHVALLEELARDSDATDATEYTRESSAASSEPCSAHADTAAIPAPESGPAHTRSNSEPCSCDLRTHLRLWTARTNVSAEDRFASATTEVESVQDNFWLDLDLDLEDDEPTDPIIPDHVHCDCPLCARYGRWQVEMQREQAGSDGDATL